MKRTNSMFNWLIACTIAIATVTSVAAAERSGHVVRLKGHARYSSGNNVWQPVKVGTILRSGYIIQTAQDSTVDIVLGEKGAAKKGSGSGTLSYQPTAEQDVIRLW